MAEINGTDGDDVLSGTEQVDTINGRGGADIIVAGGGGDTISGGTGNDVIFGGTGDDTAIVNVATDGVDRTDLGEGNDTVRVSAAAAGQIRMTFTSAEVGNGSPNDAGNLANQDGGLAVRFAQEGAGDTVVGTPSRYDDEGISFVAATDGLTFDVRDLVSGTARGDQFRTVTLGTSGDDAPGGSSGTVTPYGGTAEADYINGGAGNDVLGGGDGNDFLVGGSGNDTLTGGAGQDSILGGGGNDVINTVDSASNIFAGVIAPERDVVDAGDGDDRVTGGRLDQLAGGAGNDFLEINFAFNGPDTNPPGVTLTLDSVGSGTANDGTTISGFETVNFNLTEQADTVNTGANVRAFLTGGAGDDVLTTGVLDDVVFGGAGNDTISTGAGNDTIGGGAGNDVIMGGAGDDSLSFDPANDGSDRVDLGTGSDTVNFTGLAPSQIRLTFTSADVGNGNALDGANAANEDGGLAVRLQQEDASGNLVGAVSRFDDEGITFVEGTQGYTFDVRDLPTGTARGTFSGVVLGTSGNDTLSFFPPFREGQAFYYNGGQGDDVIQAGSGNDFLVGGAGADTLRAGAGNDMLIGGAGNDVISGGNGSDTLILNSTFANAALTFDASGRLTINSAEGRDSISGVETFRFTDITVTRDDGAPLVDDLYYYAMNPDVRMSGIDADDHYAAFGFREGRDPNALFSTNGYLAANQDVAAAGLNPLQHYDQFGFKEGRDPSANFDTQSYLRNNPDVAAAGIDPLAHYLQFGEGEGRGTSPAIGTRAQVADNGFDSEFYLLANPSAARSGLSPFDHYSQVGVKQGLDPNAYFDTSGYLQAYADVAAAGINPLTHYHQFGYMEGRDPSTTFDTSSYLAANPDVAAAGIDPLYHFLEFGSAEGRVAISDGMFDV